MGDISGLLEAIKEAKRKEEELYKTEAGRLVKRILSKETKTDEDWLMLEEDIRKFMKTASEEDKNLIFQYGEVVAMMCGAIRHRKEKESMNQ